ncbi:unnamed protein product [Musa textilis]
MHAAEMLGKELKMHKCYSRRGPSPSEPNKIQGSLSRWQLTGIKDGIPDVSCLFSLHQQMLSPLFLCQTAPPKVFFYQTEVAGSTDSESFLDQNTCCLSFLLYITKGNPALFFRC